MEAWLNCWSCEHDTLQSRLFYEKHYRVQEIFNKKESGKVDNKYYASILSTHSFYKCKKCSAPNYYVHEFWPPKENTEEAVSCFFNEIEKTGSCDHEQLCGTYHFPTFNKHKIPEWTKALPKELMLLMWEIYASYSMALPTLCAMGIRAVIDIYAVSKVGDIGSFDKKLLEMKKTGHINQTQHSVLKVITEVGNASAHRGFRPTKDQVDSCLSALEAIFFFESQKDDFQEIKTLIPKRNGRQENS